MSWNGPGVGAAPYQTAPYASGPPAYPPQQPYQAPAAPYGQPQAYPTAGPPQQSHRPPKKKGNPVITYYPPPPGYRGPAQIQGPYGQNQYPPPQPAYGPGQAVPPGYPAPGYSAPGYSAPGYPTAPAYPPSTYAPPQSYPPQPSYPQQPYPVAQNYQPPLQAYPQPSGFPGTQPYAAQQPYPQAQGWEPPTSQAPYPQSVPFSGPTGAVQDPNTTPKPISAQSAAPQVTSAADQSEWVPGDGARKHAIFTAADEWDFDFEGPIWPKANEPVDPDLSLGVIIWHPAKESTRALPATFAEAEEQALKPPPEKIGNGDSVSMYFTPENSHKAFLDVRQTDDWDEIKDDPVFVEFTDEGDRDTIPVTECILKRDRPDEPIEEVDPARNNDGQDEKMHDSNWSIMDNLEQALSGQSEEAPQKSSANHHQLKADQAQEDILAKLGVTGTPKTPSDEVVQVSIPVLDTKPPASLPPKPPAPPDANLFSRTQPSLQRAQTYAGPPQSSRGPPSQRPYASFSSSTPRRQAAPPPPPPDRQEYDPWNPLQNLPNHRNLEGSLASSARSDRMQAGSEGDTNPASATNGDARHPGSATSPTSERNGSISRKRSYGDLDPADDNSRQENNSTKRKRSSQVDSVYSRR